MGFLYVGLCGFGGVLPWARRMVVEQRRWLSAAEFTDLLGLCQFLPGPNIINMSVALGARFHGLRGALVAFAGITLAPIGVVLSLGALYERFGDHLVVQRAIGGMAAAAAPFIDQLHRGLNSIDDAIKPYTDGNAHVAQIESMFVIGLAGTAALSVILTIRKQIAMTNQ